jgi:hypothetical protein
VDQARRTFFRTLGKAGLGVGAARLLSAQTASGTDTANQILNTALVAEDLAATFYYNGLIGGAIEDPGLAGPGGTALLPGTPSNIQNIAFLRAALAQEAAHAALLRSATGGATASAAADPYQTFYFEANTFATLPAFYGVLAGIEAGLVAIYLIAVRELSALAAQTPSSVPDGPAGGPYSAAQLEYYAQVAASILGIEAEHRALGGVLIGDTQPNNLSFEQTGGLASIAFGPASALTALAPFLGATNGPGYSLATALAAVSDLGLPSAGNPPSYAQAAAQTFISASPNPIPVQPGQDGITTLSWNAPASSFVEIRVGSPSGTIFAEGGSSGSQTTGAWVGNGLTFYLQDASGGQPTLPASTLATITVQVVVA